MMENEEIYCILNDMKWLKLLELIVSRSKLCSHSSFPYYLVMLNSFRRFLVFMDDVHARSPASPPPVNPFSFQIPLLIQEGHESEKLFNWPKSSVEGLRLFMTAILGDTKVIHLKLSNGSKARVVARRVN